MLNLFSLTAFLRLFERLCPSGGVKGVNILMSRLTRSLSILVAGICWHVILPVGAVFAASKKLNLDSVADPQVTPMPSMVALFFRLVISLVIIVGITYLTMKLLRKNMKIFSKGVSIDVLDQYPFGVNKGVYITEIAGKVLVLGVTEHNINLITEITDPQVVSEIVTKAKEKEMEPIIPQSILERILPGLYSRPSSQKSSFNVHIQKQIKKLQSITGNRGGYSREDDRNE